MEKRLPCAFMQRTFQVSARRGSHDEGTYSMHARTTKFYLSQQTPVMHNLYILGLDAQNKNSNTDHKLLRLFLHFWIKLRFQLHLLPYFTWKQLLSCLFVNFPCAISPHNCNHCKPVHTKVHSMSLIQRPSFL